MSLPIRITDGKGSGKEGHVISRNDCNGPLVYTDNFKVYDTETKPFFNSEFGINLNIDATTTGTPTGVHNGGDTSYWTGSEIIGNKADFANTDTAGDLPIAGSQQIHWNNGNVLDTIQFDAGSLIPMTGFGTVTLQALVDSDWAAGDSIEFYGGA